MSAPSSSGNPLAAANGGGERSHVLFQWTSLVHVSAAFARFFAGVRMARTPEERAKAAAGGPPDLTPYRGHMRGLFDGRFKYARYFSPRQHHRPENWDDLIRHNDLELYDTRTDPGETTNLASDLTAAPRERIESLNRSLNELIGSVDDLRNNILEALGHHLNTLGELSNFIRALDIYLSCEVAPSGLLHRFQ